MFRIDKEDASGVGGGLLLYVKDKWQATCCTELNDYGFSQSLWCSVKVKTGKLLVGLCYRSPASTCTSVNNDKLLDLLTEVVQQGGYSNLLIMGDFNYPSLDYFHNSVSSGPDSAAAKFLDTTHELLLFQRVTEPTRMRVGQQPFCVDYVFTDSDNVIEEINYWDPLGKSDQVILEWDLLIETATPTSQQPKLNYCKGNYEAITGRLFSVDWKASLQNMTTNQMWITFRGVLDTLIEEYIPLKTEFRKRKGQSLWISGATIKTMKQRSTAWRKYRQFQSATNYEEYRRIRNKVNEMVKADERVYRKKLLNGFKGIESQEILRLHERITVG